MMTARVWMLGVLGASLTLAGCGGCSTGGGGNGKKGGKAKAKAKTEQPAVEESPPPPPKDTITHVLYQTKDEVFVWSEARSGTRGTKADKSFWLGSGFAVQEGEGYRYLIANGTDYFSAAAPAGAGVQPVSALLSSSTQPPAGYTWSDEVAPNGFHRVYVKPPVGERQRLGMYPEAVSAPIWLEAAPPVATGAAPALSKSSGWIAREGAPGFQNAIPQGATALTATEPAPEAVAAWSTALAKLREGGAAVKLARSANLDQDEALETLLCVSGGISAPCYIIDKVGEEERFYVTNLPWDGSDSANPPLFFQVGQDAYVMYSEPAPKDSDKPGRLSVVRSTGAGFITDTFR